MLINDVITLAMLQALKGGGVNKIMPVWQEHAANMEIRKSKAFKRFSCQKHHGLASTLKKLIS